MIDFLFRVIEPVVNFMLGLVMGIILMALILMQQPVIARVLEAQGDKIETLFFVACVKEQHPSQESPVLCRIVSSGPQAQGRTPEKNPGEYFGDLLGEDKAQPQAGE